MKYFEELFFKDGKKKSSEVRPAGRRYQATPGLGHFHRIINSTASGPLTDKYLQRYN